MRESRFGKKSTHRKVNVIVIAIASDWQREAIRTASLEIRDEAASDGSVGSRVRSKLSSCVRGIELPVYAPCGARGRDCNSRPSERRLRCPAVLMSSRTLQLSVNEPQSALYQQKQSQCLVLNSFKHFASNPR